jgi:cation transport ATPase
MVRARVVLADIGEVVSVHDLGGGHRCRYQGRGSRHVDGVVVDVSSLIGESVPVPRRPPSNVWADTMNVDVTVRS